METWETDDTGMYDTQHDGQFAMDCRGQLKLGDDGLYKFRAVRPVPYPIPSDVGARLVSKRMLKNMLTL